MKAYFEQMFRFVAWANRRSMEALRNTPAAQPEALPLLAHLLAAEHVWLSRLQQRESKHPVWPTLGIDECMLLRRRTKPVTAILSGNSLLNEWPILSGIELTKGKSS